MTAGDPEAGLHGTDGGASASARGTDGKSLPGLRGGGRGWTLVFLAAGWLFLNGFRVVLPALLPGIKADFAIGNAAAGFALTVLWLVYAVMQFPSGIAADRTGERPWIVGGALLAALSFGAFYAAPVYGLFLAACALFGLAAGLYGTPRDMLLTRTFSGADNTAYSIVFAAGNLGAASLPFIATAIAVRTDWRVAVAWLLPLLLLVGAGLWHVVPRTRSPGTGELHASETVARALAALSTPRVLLAGGVMLLFIFTFQGLTAFLPTYLVEVKDLDAGLAAALFGGLFLVSAVVQPVAGGIADRYGEQWTVTSLIGLGAVTLAALPFLEGAVAMAALMPLLGCWMAFGALVSAFIVRGLPTPVQGTGWGFLRTLFFGLGATGSTVIGLLADAGLFDEGFLLLAGLTGLAGLLWVLTPRSTIEAG